MKANEIIELTEKVKSLGGNPEPIKPILTKLKAARVQISHITSPVLYTLLCAVRL